MKRNTYDKAIERHIKARGVQMGALMDSPTKIRWWSPRDSLHWVRNLRFFENDEAFLSDTHSCRWQAKEREAEIRDSLPPELQPHSCSHLEVVQGRLLACWMTL